MKNFNEVMDVFNDFISDLVAELEKISESVVLLKETELNQLDNSINDIAKDIDKLTNKLS